MSCTHTCGGCLHWKKIEPKASARLEGTIGECRQGPPRANFNWPRTKAIDSCGQYESAAQFAEAEASRVSAPVPARGQLTLDAGTTGGAPLPTSSGSGNRPRRGQRAQA